MSYTAQQVFDASMYFLDNQSDAGIADVSDNAEYKYRTPTVLNMLVAQLYPYSDTYPALTSGTRPTAAKINNMTDAIPLDDVLASSVLPLGLAFMLVLNEDKVLASNLKAMYDEALAHVMNKVPTASEAITDVYGIVYTDEE